MSPLLIFTNVILPIFVLIGLGVLLDRAFKLDVRTLTRISFYIFSPVVVFLGIFNTDLQAGQLVSIVLIEGSLIVAMFLIAALLFSGSAFAGKRGLCEFGAMFFNGGNYGFPLMLLAFGEWAVGVMAIVLLVQALGMFTIGVLLMGGADDGPRDAIIRLLKIPVVYAIPLGFALRLLHVTLPVAISTPLQQINNGFISMALLTLGVQLSRSRIAGEIRSVLTVTGVRLLLSPLVAFGLVLLFKPGPQIAPVLAIAGGLPVAVNLFVLSVEFEQDADFGSRLVFWSTLLSAVTIPLLLIVFR